MSFIEIKGQQIELDEDGFIVEPDLWSTEIAEYFAKEEEVEELTEQHWKIINYLKDYFKQFGIAPMVRKVCKDNAISMQELYQPVKILYHNRLIQSQLCFHRCHLFCRSIRIIKDHFQRSSRSHRRKHIY